MNILGINLTKEGKQYKDNYGKVWEVKYHDLYCEAVDMYLSDYYTLWNIIEIEFEEVEYEI